MNLNVECQLTCIFLGPSSGLQPISFPWGFIDFIFAENRWLQTFFQWIDPILLFPLKVNPVMLMLSSSFQQCLVFRKLAQKADNLRSVLFSSMSSLSLHLLLLMLGWLEAGSIFLSFEHEWLCRTELQIQWEREAGHEGLRHHSSGINAIIEKYPGISVLCL